MPGSPKLPGHEPSTGSDSGSGYRSFTGDPRELRPRSANRGAALALVLAIVVVIAVLALFG